MDGLGGINIIEKGLDMINLLDYRSDVNSTIGNDGIIEYIFDRLQIDKGLFVEFGAWDGVKNSNCKKLFDSGWEGIFIEPDRERYGELKHNYRKNDDIICLRKKVGFLDDELFDKIVDPYLNGR